MLERVWREGNPPTLLVGMQIGKALWKAVWRFPKKTKNRDTVKPCNSTPEHISREKHGLKVQIQLNVLCSTGQRFE